MSFGVLKSGMNNTDKKLVLTCHKAHWPVDRIASKVEVAPKMVVAYIKHATGETVEYSASGDVQDLSRDELVAQLEALDAEELQENTSKIIATHIDPDNEFDAEEIAEMLGLEVDFVENVIDNI